MEDLLRDIWKQGKRIKVGLRGKHLVAWSRHPDNGTSKTNQQIQKLNQRESRNWWNMERDQVTFGTTRGQARNAGARRTWHRRRLEGYRIGNRRAWDWRSPTAPRTGGAPPTSPWPPALRRAADRRNPTTPSLGFRPQIRIPLGPPAGLAELPGTFAKPWEHACSRQNHRRRHE